MVVALEGARTAEVTQAAPDRRGGLLAWQAGKGRTYIDSHITGPVRVAELCALIQLSEAHFSRAFRRTFGKSPHAFVIRRRVELAAQYMLQTEAPMSDIALRCGFADQPHLCKLFRHITGHSAAAWRRAHRSDDDGDRHRGTPRSPQGRSEDPRRQFPSSVMQMHMGNTEGARHAAAEADG